ncbi:Fanconi anemia, complementation group D2 isoform X2 [Mucor ambiguus]|uniref:Fanconi anemia, complementation group D2 isoform X2 n=1 Tax=Mucor ambiguus TaxID=91626 RepID=A0A0C9M0U6_9FUNG|nr:Fanconi anemia, complementation group D2 isoform X2 [Mucor ambiguus]
MSFVDVLRELGCSIESEGIVFAVEPVLFRRKLASHLKLQPQAAAIFNKDIQEHTEDILAFRKFLLPSQIDETVVQRANRSSTSESLFKTLLAIDSIQSELITYLLERLPEFYDELENDVRDSNSSSCTARLILHQLRWLDYIAEPGSLTGKLIEIIQITPPIIQHEMITSLPDIINDSEHKPIVVYLKELMNENGNLTVPILDALSNLTLHSESLEDVRETVLDRLESANLDDLAVIIKFMLQTVTPMTIDQVVWGIRQKLNFRSLGKSSSGGDNNHRQSTTTKPSTMAPEALILESIKMGLQFHKFVCDSWFKSIVALETKRDHKLIDMMVLIILYSMTSMKKKVESVIKKKIIHGYITGSLMKETIGNHPDGLAGYWSTILSLAESLLRASQQNNTLSPCASVMYISAFKSTDAYYRQEIVGALVTHIGSGVEVEMNVALNVLLELVKTDVSSVVVYSVFVKGILDYLDNLNEYQIRTLFDIFSVLALTTGSEADGSGNLWSEIQTIIRKQLSNPREKYKHIGIIASLSAVKVLGSKKLCNAFQDLDPRGGGGAGGSSSTQVSRAMLAQTAERHPILHKAIDLLEFALSSTKEYPSCITLMYDELAHLIGEEDIDERLELWVKENMTLDFTEFYVISSEDADEDIAEAKNNEYRALEPERKMGLDESEITVKMFDLLCNNLDIRKKKYLIVPMCAIFHLLASCEKKLNNGSLQGIDALFGCSVVLFNHQDVSDLSTEELETACNILFYTINWFKELLNAFMFNTEEEQHQTRLISRLRSILAMEYMLEQLIQQVPHYVPLELHMTSHSAESSIKTTAGLSIIDTQQSHVSATESQSHSNSTSNKSKSNNSNSKLLTSIKLSSVQDLRSYTRAFDVDILALLKYNEQVEEEEGRLTLEEMDYILQDIEQKLDIKIAPPAPVFFGKKKVVQHQHSSCNVTSLARISSRTLMKKIVVYLPTLCQTLENLYADLQEREMEPGQIEGSENLITCITRIFDIIYKLISWPDIEIADNRDILKDLIEAIAQRASADDADKNPKQAFEYLSNYITGIPKATTAVLLYKILLRCMALFNDIDNTYALRVVNHIVSTDWFDWRDIQKEIPFLFEESIEKSPESLALLSQFVNTELSKYEEEGTLENYPLLKSDTVNQHYQAIFNQAVKAFDLLKDTDKEAEIVLMQTAHIVKIFERLTKYVKNKENRVLIGVLLKTGRLYIEQFTKHTIPFFTSTFKEHTHSILAIFKDFQSSTRLLQIICSHVKVLKDVSHSAYVPPLKKALEIVIYQVKMLLIENRVPQSAFFMGALKHRDIKGDEVSSQIPKELSDEDEDEEEMVDELETIQEENEDQAEVMEEDNDEDEAGKENKPKKAKRKSIETTASKRKRNKTSSNAKKQRPSSSSKKSNPQVSYRTSSIVPSSSDEEEEEQPSLELDSEEEQLPEIKKKKFVDLDQDDDEEEAVMDHSQTSPIEFSEEFLATQEDEQEDNTEEQPLSPMPVSPLRSPSPAPVKPKRIKQVGLAKKGRSRPSNTKTFNFSGPR